MASQKVTVVSKEVDLINRFNFNGLSSRVKFLKNVLGPEAVQPKDYVHLHKSLYARLNSLNNDLV